MTQHASTSSLQVLSVTIENCLGCKEEHFKFSQASNVHLFLYNLENSDGTARCSFPVTPLSQALQLMCSTQYKDAESLRRLPQLDIGTGSVRMKFSMPRMEGVLTQGDADPESDLDTEPSTSQQALTRRLQRQARRLRRRMMYDVNVHRRFDDEERLDRIMYQVDLGEWRMVTVAEFHEMFLIQPTYYADLLSRLQQDYATNWLHIIQADASSCINFRDASNPFNTFVRLLDRQHNEHHRLLKTLATNYLAAQETIRRAECRFLLQIFDKVRTIFECLTSNKYTVWFFVPRLNRFTPLDQVNVDDFDFCNVRTVIRLMRDQSDSFWPCVDHNIMDVLLVAFQLALAKASNQTFLFLGHLEKLCEFVCLQHVTASYMNLVQSKVNPKVPSKWCYLPYLRLIIDLCEALGLVVFIEYPGALTNLKQNRQVIKCVQKRNPKTGAVSWKLKEGVTDDLRFKVNAARDVC